MKIIVLFLVINITGWIIGTLLVRKLISEYENIYNHKVNQVVPDIPTKHIASLFVTPRLPVTITPDLQYCIMTSSAFILKSEYISTMITPNVSEFTIHIPYTDGSDVKYIHRPISSDGYLPSLDEVWSEEYIDALNKNIAYSTYQNIINELIMSIKYANVDETDIHSLIDMIDHNRDIIIPTSEDEIRSVLITTLPNDINRAIKLAISHDRKDRRFIVDAFRYPKYRILSNHHKNNESQDQEETDHENW